MCTRFRLEMPTLYSFYLNIPDIMQSWQSLAICASGAITIIAALIAYFYMYLDPSKKKARTVVASVMCPLGFVLVCVGLWAGKAHT